MNHISCEELKRKMDLDEQYVLVNALDEARFRAVHIPTSINVCKDGDIERCLSLDDFIVIYCSDEACNRSIILYQQLDSYGYKKIYRFAGGLRAWEEAGYELSGELVA